MPAAIRFRCYYCHRIHTVDEAAVGRRGRCVCGKLMVVPPPPSLEDASRGDDRALPMALASRAPGELAGREPEGPGEIPLVRGPVLPPAELLPAVEPESASRPLAPVAPAAAPLPEVDREGSRAAEKAMSAARPPPPAASAWKGGSTMSATIYVILSLFALAAWVFHQFFTGENPTFGTRLWQGDPNYLTLPAAFWSTLLFALFLALALEGIHRARAARR